MVALTSCGLLGDRGDVTQKDDTYLITAPSGGLTEAGYGYGARLAFVGDCVGLNFGSARWAVAIWPAETSLVSTDPLTIDIPGEGPFQEGDLLPSAGGANYYGTHPLRGVEVPEGCRGEDLVSFTAEP